MLWVLVTMPAERARRGAVAPRSGADFWGGFLDETFRCWTHRNPENGAMRLKIFRRPPDFPTPIQYG